VAAVAYGSLAPAPCLSPSLLTISKHKSLQLKEEEEGGKKVGLPNVAIAPMRHPSHWIINNHCALIPRL